MQCKMLQHLHVKYNLSHHASVTPEAVTLRSMVLVEMVSGQKVLVRQHGVRKQGPNLQKLVADTQQPDQQGFLPMLLTEHA